MKAPLDTPSNYAFYIKLQSFIYFQNNQTTIEISRTNLIIYGQK